MKNHFANACSQQHNAVTAPARTLCRLIVIYCASFYPAYSLAVTGHPVQIAPEQIAQTKQLLQANALSSPAQKALTSLYQAANHSLSKPLESVTEKTFIPRHATKHDYVSLSRYWWPNPKKKDGLPWIRKDGVTNPTTQTDAVDRPRLERMATKLHTLALAYYFSDDEKYATRGIDIIRTWFLNPATRMNPNVNFGQMVPGQAKGRRSGMLDTRLLSVWVLDSIYLLSHSPSWSDTDHQQILSWFEQYLTWLTTNPLGRSGLQQPNNHGSWYRMQAAGIAYFLDNDKQQERMYRSFKRTLGSQIRKDGVQKHEIERTKALFYSYFNLDAMTRLATIAQHHDTNLWQVKTKSGANLRSAVDYLLPFIHNPSNFPYAQKHFNTTLFIDILMRAIIDGKQTQYREDLAQLAAKLTDTHPRRKRQQQRLTVNYYLLHPSLSAAAQTISPQKEQ